MKITHLHRFLWNTSSTIFWIIVLLGNSITFDNPWTIPVGVGARVLTAFWMVQCYQQTKIEYGRWREERLHSRIRPITTEPPEVYLK